MVGLIQKMFIDMLMEVLGEERLNEIKHLAKIPLDKKFQINLVYADDEWQRLFNESIKALKLTQEQGELVYAEFFLKDALKRFPVWFEMSKNSYAFLSIQPTIHNCFATGVADEASRDAINDKFRVEQPLPNKLITYYRSKNQHCGLYKGLAQCVINHYKDEAIIEENKCMKKGQEECEIHIQWSKLGA